MELTREAVSTQKAPRESRYNKLSPEAKRAFIAAVMHDDTALLRIGHGLANPYSDTTPSKFVEAICEGCGQTFRYDAWHSTGNRCFCGLSCANKFNRSKAHACGK